MKETEVTVNLLGVVPSALHICLRHKPLLVKSAPGSYMKYHDLCFYF